MTANALYSQVAAPSSSAQVERFELVDEKMSSPPPPPHQQLNQQQQKQQQQQQPNQNQNRPILPRLDSTVMPNPPCMTAGKLLSQTFDFSKHSELWPHEIFDIELKLEGTTWERLTNPSSSSGAGAAAEPSSVQSAVSANVNNDKPNSSHSISKYPMLTVEELCLGKPHPDAFFCPIEWTWLIISSIDQSQTPLSPRCHPPNFEPFSPSSPSTSTSSSLSTTTTVQNSDQHQYHFFQHFQSSVGSVPNFRRRPLSIFDGQGSRNSQAEILKKSLSSTSDDGDRSLRLDARLCYNCKGGIICTSLDSSVPSIFKKHDALRMIDRARKYDHNNQNPNFKPEQLVYRAWHTVFILIQNALVEGKISSLPLEGKSISGRMPWDPISAKIWESLLIKRREEEPPTTITSPKSPPSKDNKVQQQKEEKVKKPFLVLPNLNVKTEEGRFNRAIWVRAFLEVSVFLKHWKLKYPFVEENSRSNYIVPINLVPASPKILNLLGGDPIPKIQIKSSWQSTNGRPIGYSSYSKLGILNNVPDRVVILGYQVQLKCFKNLKFEFFDALREIKSFREGECEEIDLFIGLESSNGAIGMTEVRESWKMICGENGIIDLSREDFIANEFNKKMDSLDDQSTDRNALKEALHVLVQANPESALLRAIYDSTSSITNLMNSKSKEPMDINKAYVTLGDVVPETEDEVLWFAYTIGISDQPGQKDLLREAVQVIANHRKSQLLKNRLADENCINKSGSNSSGCMDVIPYSPPAVSYDLPAGLNNIGNTCYLNSLLQYFFSVRELREVLLKFPEYEQDVEEDLILKEKKRVGGRIVSVPEVLRSKQFASKLQGLFHEMIHTPLSAVTPERELAFLALVLSKDESPSAQPSNNQDSSASTDATLVDERPGFIGPVYNPPPSSPPPLSSSTVLGKRKSESVGSDDGHQAIKPSMEIDSEAQNDKKRDDEATPDGDVKMSTGLTPTPVDSQATTVQLVEPPAEGHKSIVIDLTEEASGPPPLPPRPTKSRSLAVTDSGSHMMFGRQNDVSECMDNCLFQIQAALDESKLSTNISFGEEGNIVKSLFYGKTRQSLSFESPEGKVSVKEEPFAYLLVDVAEEGRDLYDGLDRVFDESEVELENGKAVRRIGLVDLPPILQIQLQRVQFDRRTHTVFKSNAYIKFTELLKIDRYLEPDPNDKEALEKRTQTLEKRKQIECLRGRAGELRTHVGADKRTASTVLRDLHQILSTNDVNSNTIRSEYFKGLLDQNELEFLEDEAKSIDQELLEINQKIKDLKEEVERTWSTDQSSSTDSSTGNKKDGEDDKSKMDVEKDGEIKDEEMKSQEPSSDNLENVIDKNDDDDDENDENESKDKMIIEDQIDSDDLKKVNESDSSKTKKNKSAEYRLVSLFIHRGTANGGHYWAIQRQLPDKPDRWLKYNDSVVSEIDPKSEVFSETNDSTANPYWLTYVRVGEEHRFEMVNRKVN